MENKCSIGREFDMGMDEYTQPQSCITGRRYFLKITHKETMATYQSVEFIGYRPHPAEVLVHDGIRARVIHRNDLFQKNGGQIGPG
jgi:hypothetical protein